MLIVSLTVVTPGWSEGWLKTLKSVSVPHLNGVPINQLPGMDRLAPDVLEAIGKGPVGRTIFVRNLAYTVDEAKIKEVFGMAGTIQDIELVKDKDGKFRGFGTITFAQVDTLRQTEIQSVNTPREPGHLLHNILRYPRY